MQFLVYAVLYVFYHRIGCTLIRGGNHSGCAFQIGCTTCTHVRGGKHSCCALLCISRVRGGDHSGEDGSSTSFPSSTNTVAVLHYHYYCTLQRCTTTTIAVPLLLQYHYYCTIQKCTTTTIAVFQNFSATTIAICGSALPLL